MQTINLGRLVIPVIVPQKGVDYYTETEKQEFITEITNNVNSIIQPQETIRQTNEASRVSAELIRQSNEDTRQNNEEIRQTNESSRQSAETSRAESEILRQTSEISRQSAESTRSSTFTEKMEAVDEAIADIEDKTEAYNNNATQKTTDFDTNARSKTNYFDDNAILKTTAFNANAVSRTNAFNTNATNKTNEFDSHVASLQTKITNLEETVNSELEDGVAEGTEITVNDSAVADASLDIAGNTEQTQRNYKGLLMVPEELSKTTSGMTFNINNDGSVAVTGTSTENISIYLQLNTPLTLNGTYTFSLKTVGTGAGNSQQWHLRESEGTTSIFGPVVIAGNTSTITKEVNVTINYLQIYIGANKTFNCTIYPILEEGSTATDWDSATTHTSPNPDYPQDIHILKGSNTIKISNKNWFDGYEDGYINSNTGANETREGAIRSYYIPVKPDVTYSMTESCDRYVEYDNNKNFIKCNFLKAQGKTKITNSSNTAYVRLGFSTIPTSLNIFQFEESPTATSYEPHKEITKTLTLPSGMEMCKIGDYKDEFVKDLETGKWYKDENVGKVILNGSENYTLETSSNLTRFYTTLSDILNLEARNANALSNYFYPTTANRKGAIMTYKNRILMYPIDDSIDSAEKFKEWLNNNPVTVYYILETPVLKEITDETLIAELDELLELRTYFGQTNITVEAEDLPPMMTLNYKKSNRILRSEIDTIKARLDLLEG